MTLKSIRFSRGLTALAGLLLISLLLSACGNTNTTATATTQSQPASTINSAGTTSGTVAGVAPNTNAGGADAAAGAEGGLAGTGDEPTVVYTDPSGQFSFQHPRSWGNTTKPGETIRYTGRDEFISVVVTTTGLTPLEFAKTDAAALNSASPGFKGAAPQSYKVAGQNGAMVAYTWQNGPSPVTGKMVPSAANRYYVPGPNGKLAIFTYSSPTNNYDPAGADDFANAFRWLK